MLPWLVSNTATAALLGALVWLVTRRGRLSPGVAHLLWLAVLVRLASPLGLLWPVSLAPTPATPAAVPLSLPAPGEVFDAAGNLPQTPPGAEAFDWARYATPALLGAWLFGAALVLSRGLRTARRVGRALRLAGPPPESIARAARREAERLGARVPEVVQVPGAAGPFVWCWGRPKLVWPEGLEDRLPAEAVAGVLSHELAHLRRGDHWVRRLTLLLGVAFWFHPLFWWARREIDRQAELACDQLAARRGPRERRAYAEALLEVSRLSPGPALAVGMAAGGKADLERRLRLVMASPSAPRRRSWAWAAALLAAPGWLLLAPESAVGNSADADAGRVSFEYPADAGRGSRLAEALRSLLPPSSGCSVEYAGGTLTVRADADSAAVLDAWVRIALRPH